jgi:hypothetical protein
LSVGFEERLIIFESLLARFSADMKDRWRASAAKKEARILGILVFFIAYLNDTAIGERELLNYQPDFQGEPLEVSRLSSKKAVL